MGERLDRLSRLKAEDRAGIRELSAEIRTIIEGIAIPEDVQEAIIRSHSRLGEQAAYAVRSSATAEDLPTASFAGQQDTYLNVIGKPAILAHVSRCWASLFTERAVSYRLQHGFDHRKVYMAVVVQKNEKMMAWLGEKSAADTLSQSVPNNITSEMGLALLDVGDAIRPHPEVIEYSRRSAKDDPPAPELHRLP